MLSSLRIAFGSALAAFPLIVVNASEGHAQDLQSFGVVSGQSLTNTGPTTIVGNIAVSPGTSFTGSGSVTQTGETFLGDAVAIRIQNDLTTLYSFLAGRPTSSGGNLTGQDLGGMTLMPGVYNFDSSANLASGQTLTLDGAGNPNSIFVINIGSTLTAGSGSSVILQNGAQGGNVFYRVGSSATLDTSASLQGQIVALTSITMNTTAALGCGAVLARNGSVTLDTNTIGICDLDGTGFDDVLPPVILDPVLPDPVTPGPVVTPPTVPAEPAPVVTVTQRSLIMALTTYRDGGGTLPVPLAILPALQTPQELTTSLTQLPGGVTAFAPPLIMQGLTTFMETVVRSGRTAPTTGSPQTPNDFTTPPVTPRGPTTGPRDPRDLAAIPRRVVPPRDGGVPVGMVPEKIHTPYSGKFGSKPDGGYITLAYPEAIEPQQRNWNIWATGSGSRSVTDADGVLGFDERVSKGRGFAIGLNYAPSHSANIGVAIGKSVARLDLANGLGSLRSESLFFALRGRTASERAYVEGTLVYGNSNITTDRTVTIAGTDRFISETQGKSLAASVEAGYKMGVFTPFVGLRAQSFETPTHAETTASGSSSYALQYDALTTTSLRSELGVDMQWSKGLSDGGVSSFGVRAAWAHEFASNNAGMRSFQSLPGLVFPVTAPSGHRNSVILAANVSVAGNNGFSIGAGLNAELSKGTRDYGSSLTATYRW